MSAAGPLLGRERQARGPTGLVDHAPAAFVNDSASDTARSVASRPLAGPHPERTVIFARRRGARWANRCNRWMVDAAVVDGLRVAFTRVGQGRQWFSWPGSWVERGRRLSTPAGPGRSH